MLTGVQECTIARLKLPVYLTFDFYFEAELIIDPLNTAYNSFMYKGYIFFFIERLNSY